MGKLQPPFYQSDDVVTLSRSLLGKHLFTKQGKIITGGRILETEAYRGPEDKACHAYNNRRTTRTEVMFHKGGICYVYMCYGIHYLLNIVTGEEGCPHAILIRAIEPLVGIEKMLERRGKTHLDNTLTSGPGSLSQALGIDKKFNSVPITGEKIWIEEREPSPSSDSILVGPRVGIDYAGEDALLPWRFRLVTRTNRGS